MNQKQYLGRWGEEKAAQYLKEKGWQIRERNYKNYFGEIDIIAQKKKKIVFVEVKTREGKKNEQPEEAVNLQKRKKLLAAAEKYILDNKIKGECRIDVIAIIKEKETGKVYLTHFQNAVRYF